MATNAQISNKVHDVVPLEMRIPGKFVSADASIDSRVQVKYRPQQSGDVDLSTTGQKTEVIISSVDGFLDMSKSHLEFDLQLGMTRGGFQEGFAALCTGGAHSMIKRLQLYEGSDVLICEVPEYAKCYGLMSNYMHSAESVRTLGWHSGDSELPDLEKLWCKLPTYLVASVTESAGVFTLTLVEEMYNDDGTRSADDAFPEMFESGDYFRFYNQSLEQWQTGVLSSCTKSIDVADADAKDAGAQALGVSTTTRTLVFDSTINALRAPDTVATTEANVGVIEYIPGRILKNNPRHWLMLNSSSGSENRVQIGLGMLGLFNIDRWIPLRYFRQLRLVIEWEHDWKCMHSMVPYVQQDTTSADITSTNTVVIKNLELITSQVIPANKYLAAWNNMYMDPTKGIPFEFSSFYHYEVPLATNSASASYVIPATFLSARMVIGAIYVPGQYAKGTDPDKSFVDGLADVEATGQWWFLDKTGMFVPAGISAYEFLHGAKRFPADGKVVVNTFGGENFAHNQKTFQKFGKRDQAVRFNFDELMGVNPYGRSKEKIGSKLSGVSKKTIFTADLSKQGVNTGLNLRGHDLIFDFEAAGYETACHLHFWIIYDSQVFLSGAGGRGIQLYR